MGTTGILKFLNSICVQPAVYWGGNVKDGYGGETFSIIKQINCRWEDKMEIVVNKDAEQVTSKAKILVMDDLNLGGWLWLGSLADLQNVNSNWQDPKQVENAFRIINIQKTPLFKATDAFVKYVYV